MENRRLVVVLILVMLPVLLFWGKGVDLFYKTMGWPIPDPTKQVASDATPATAPSATTTFATTSSSTSQPTTGVAASISAGNAPMIVTPALPQSPVATSLGTPNRGDGLFAIQVTIDPVGAGLSSVVLNSFDLTQSSSEPYVFEEPLPSHPEMKALASKNIRVDGTTYDLASVRWSLVSQTPTEAVYGANLTKDGTPLVEIRKQFDVARRATDDKKPTEDLGYELAVRLSFANKTDHALTLQTAFNGPVIPPMETLHDRQIVTGADKAGSVDLEYHPIEELKPDKDDGKIDLTINKDRKIHWAGAVSNYFGAIVLPGKLNVNGTDSADNYIATINAQGLNLDQELIDSHQGYLTFQTGDIKLAAGDTATIPLSAYFGPKQRDVLNVPHYVQPPRGYNLLLVIKSGLCAMCTFDWMLQGLAWLLRTMHFIFRDWGLAIIGLVAIVRVCLHPITRRSQISMSRMSKLGPEMKKLQEKHKDDKEAYQREMMRYQKEQGIGPYLGCLPMFLQLPIWAALYGVLQTTFELRHARFLGHLTWIHDLSQPDYIWKFATPVHIPLPLIGFDLRGICVLPFLLAGAMYLQAKFMPQAAAATPEQMQQQKMMRVISPIMFLLIFYSYPSGLSLYVATSTVVGIIESKIVRDHIKAKEEAEKAGKVFVTTKATRASRQGQLGSRSSDGDEKTGGIFGGLSRAWASMIEQAEQATKDKNKRNDRK